MTANYSARVERMEVEVMTAVGLFSFGSEFVNVVTTSTLDSGKVASPSLMVCVVGLSSTFLGGVTVIINL